MFVLADMEWMTNENGHYSPTQLAAVKVDENWNIVDKFESLLDQGIQLFTIGNTLPTLEVRLQTSFMLVKDIMFSQHSTIGYLKTILSYGGI